MGSVEAGRGLVQRVDHDHRGADRAGAVERAPQRIRQQHGPEPLSLTFLRDGQAPDQRGTHQRVARDVLARRLRNIAPRDHHGAQRVVAQHVGRRADLAQDAAADLPGAEPHPSGSPGISLQDDKLGFLNGNVDRQTVSPDRVEALASADILQAGSVIAAALLTGLSSDLPGRITAQVTEHVYDSPTGQILLIPQSARLVGEYDPQVAFGQSRALLVWTGLIMPNGQSIVLERQPGGDTDGYAGLEDQVDSR
jgi:type IV secretory pathway VirB10-like protein